MAKNSVPDFVQPAATVYLGTSPQKGVFYELRSGAGYVTAYCVPTGEQQKNGKYVVLFADTEPGPRKKVKTVALDSVEFRHWHRCEVVPGKFHARLTDI